MYINSWANILVLVTTTEESTNKVEKVEIKMTLNKLWDPKYSDPSSAEHKALDTETTDNVSKNILLKK